MKLLIVTAPLGNGHNAVADAVAGTFSRLYPKSQCQILDMYEYISPTLKKATASGYFVSMKTLSKIHGMASEIIDHTSIKEFNEYTPARLANDFMASELRHAIDAFAPDCIVCTMVFTAQVVDLLKERGVVTCPCYGIITDYTVQNYWSDVENFEWIVSPNESMEPQFLRRGIDYSRVLPFGIPVHESFCHKHDQREARRRLGLDETRPAILIMSGGMGFGNMEEYVKEIDAVPLDLQIVVVCGKNERLHQKVSRMTTRKPITVYGFVDNVDEIMDACDCLLSKPGGLTTSESLAKELPMMMIDPLPGVEDRNVEFLQAHGAAIYITTTFQISDALFLLFHCPGRLERIRESIRSIAKPNATLDLCHHIAQTISEKTEGII